MFEFKLPDIGEGLAEAEIISWTVDVGQIVKEGDNVVEISTDKVTVELASPRDGQIAEICAAEGDIVKVGTVILRIEGENKGEAASEHKKSDTKNAEIKAPKAKAAKVRTSPAVRRFAAENDVVLSNVIGSGAEGMILRQDVEAYLDNDIVESSEKRIKLTGAGLSAAQNLIKSSKSMATTSISFDINANNLDQAVKDNNLTPLTLITLCLKDTLSKHPKFNATIDEDNNELIIASNINLGIAVTTKDQLLVPVIENTNNKNAPELTAVLDDIVIRARANKLKANEMRGSTFTLSSTGGIEQTIITSTTPIINHPNVAVLWVSRYRDRPWVSGGALAVAKIMSCTLAFDHRFLHGADGLAFINDFNKSLQNPSSLL